MLSVSNEAQLQQLRSGDRIKYRGVHWQVKNYSTIEKRNNPAAGAALAGLLIATGNIVRIAFAAEFQNWVVSFTQNGLVLVFSLISLVAIRWLADLILVPGVKISDEIVNQEVPNLGAGLIEAFAYIAASFLIAWCLS